MTIIERRREAIIREVVSEMPFHKHIGLEIEALDEYGVTLVLTNRPELIGRSHNKLLHGGVIASVLDVVGACTIFDRLLYYYPDLDEGRLMTRAATLDLHIDFLSPGVGEKFYATAELIKLGQQVSNARMRLTNEKKRLIASGSGNFFVGTK